MWEIYTRKNSIEVAFDKFMSKWKRENEEFTEALYLIKNASLQGSTKMEKILDESVSVILNGTKERMKNFARDLRTPVTVINALGILLPLIGIVFFPIMSMFMPEVIQPLTLAVGYTVLLPLTVYWLMKIYLEKRPYTFHQPNISKHPQFKKEKLFNKLLISSLLISVSITFFGFSSLYQGNLAIDAKLYFSLIITWGIAIGIIIYTTYSARNKIKLRNEITKIESEFPEALFQIGNRLALGIPLESALKEIYPKIKHLKISDFINRIIYNIETFGMTLEQAIFDKKYGAINYYPSDSIETIMKAIVEIQKKGSSIVSKSMVVISSYLKDMHSVEEDLKDIMGEVTSTLTLQSILLAPLSAGIVVALAAIIMEMLLKLGTLASVYQGLEGYGAMGTAGSGVLTSFINVDKIIPIDQFQMIVGIYKVEIVTMMSIFSSIIENGDESILKRKSIGKRLLISVIIYSVIMVSIYSIFSSMITTSGLR